MPNSKIFLHKSKKFGVPNNLTLALRARLRGLRPLRLLLVVVS
jgi:hypothetical protein